MYWDMPFVTVMGTDAPTLEKKVDSVPFSDSVSETSMPKLPEAAVTAPPTYLGMGILPEDLRVSSIDWTVAPTTKAS